jgi:hypothetical protein
MNFREAIFLTVLCFLIGIGFGALAFYDLLVAIPMNLSLGICGLIISILFLWITVRGIWVCQVEYRYRNKW